MFDELTTKLAGVFRKLTGRGRLSEQDVRDAVREIRRVLLEADVNLAVARDADGREETRTTAFFCPIDAEIEDADTLVSLDAFYQALDRSEARVKVMFVDACRNDPIASTNVAAGRSLSGAKNPPNAKDSAKKGSATARVEPPKSAPAANSPAELPGRGLAPVEVNDNVLVAFAAAAGTK